jgi:cyclic pyranopterin phosphate synthase
LKGSRVLRISVTDRCDLRCVYCMPESGVALVPSGELLTYEEIETVARAALDTGIRRFRVTGGEPLVRRDLPVLIEKLARLEADDLALTTNGTHLAGASETLRSAGLMRVTVSLDTLREERFEKITRRKGLGRIMAGIEAARKAGLEPVKINTVVIRGVNDDEVEDFVRFAGREGLEVRFIELMPTSGLSPECKELGRWRPSLFLKSEDIRARIEDAFGPLEPGGDGGGVARIYHLSPGTRLGFISPISEPFCRGCERLRLGADGRLKLCLFDKEGIDVKQALREGRADSSKIREFLETSLERKSSWERGALEVLSSDMFKVGG